MFRVKKLLFSIHQELTLVLESYKVWAIFILHFTSFQRALKKKNISDGEKSYWVTDLLISWLFIFDYTFKFSTFISISIDFIQLCQKYTQNFWHVVGLAVLPKWRKMQSKNRWNFVIFRKIAFTKFLHFMPFGARRINHTTILALSVKYIYRCKIRSESQIQFMNKKYKKIEIYTHAINKILMQNQSRKLRTAPT